MKKKIIQLDWEDSEVQIINFKKIEAKETTKADKKSFLLQDKNIGIKGNFLSGVTLTTEDETIVMCSNKWYESILIFMPYLYIILGIFFGAIGGGLSTIAAVSCCVTNAYILRSKGNLAVKVILCLVLFTALFVIWFYITLLIAAQIVA